MSAPAPLPAGFHSQPAYEFRDPSGRYSYEFSNVYGPPQRGGRGFISQLDEERSYWSVVGDLDEVEPARRAISYAEARRALRGRLTFAQFASEMHMRGELVRRLGASANANRQ